MYVTNSSCTWEGSPCNESDFKVSLTEFGQCYTFNSGEDYQSLYKAVITGGSIQQKSTTLGNRPRIYVDILF